MTLVGYWPLTEDSGGTVYDCSGNGNNGVVNGATPANRGILGSTCHRFDGIDDYIETTSEINIGTSDWTVSSWYYPIASDEYGHILSSASHQNDFACKIASGSLKPYFFSDSGRTHSDDASKSMSLDTWEHIVYSYDNSSIKIYLNGGLIVDVSVTGLDIPTVKYRINGVNGEFVEAKHSEIRFYDHCLTPGEIQYLYNVGQNAHATFTPNPTE